jgi:hypothetical protein
MKANKTFEDLDRIVNQIILGEEVTGLNKKNYSIILQEWESSRNIWLFVFGPEYGKIEKLVISTIISLKRNEKLESLGI